MKDVAVSEHGPRAVAALVVMAQNHERVDVLAGHALRRRDQRGVRRAGEHLRAHGVSDRRVLSDGAR
jgi:hypothetical protein